MIKKRRSKRVKYSLGWEERSEGHVGKESQARRKCRDDVGGQGTNCTVITERTAGRERGGGGSQGAVWKIGARTMDQSTGMNLTRKCAKSRTPYCQPHLGLLAWYHWCRRLSEVPQCKNLNGKVVMR
jgi:hypothetical protein